MPRYDKTGPRGLGPRTGRGLGKCLPKEEISIVETEVYLVKKETIPEKIIRKIL